MKNHKETLEKIKEHIQNSSKEQVYNELTDAGLDFYRNTPNVLEHKTDQLENESSQIDTIIKQLTKFLKDIKVELIEPPKSNEVFHPKKPFIVKHVMFENNLIYLRGEDTIWISLNDLRTLK